MNSYPLITPLVGVSGSRGSDPQTRGGTGKKKAKRHRGEPGHTRDTVHTAIPLQYKPTIELYRTAAFPLGPSNANLASTRALARGGATRTWLCNAGRDRPEEGSRGESFQPILPLPTLNLRREGATAVPSAHHCHRNATRQEVAKTKEHVLRIDKMLPIESAFPRACHQRAWQSAYARAGKRAHPNPTASCRSQSVGSH